MKFMSYHLHEALRGGQDGFYVLLFRAIIKADLENREKLRKGFPEQVAEWEAYLKGEVEE